MKRLILCSSDETGSIQFIDTFLLKQSNLVSTLIQRYCSKSKNVMCNDPLLLLVYLIYKKPRRFNNTNFSIWSHIRNKLENTEVSVVLYLDTHELFTLCNLRNTSTADETTEQHILTCIDGN